MGSQIRDLLSAEEVVQANRLQIDGLKEAALGVVRTLSPNIVLITSQDGSGRRL